MDVRVILPHIPDKKYAFALSKSRAYKLSKRGIKFYEFTPGFMHAKSLICDNTLYIGSYNLDYRSLQLNCECGFCVDDGEVLTDAEKDFLNCLTLSKELKVEATPFKKFTWAILRMLAPLM